MDNLGLDQGKYPIDSIRAEIKVQQIADEAVDAVNEAKNKEGETSDLQSTKYAISYKADSSNGADMARAVSYTHLDVYKRQAYGGMNKIEFGDFGYIVKPEVIYPIRKRKLNSHLIDVYKRQA